MNISLHTEHQINYRVAKYLNVDIIFELVIYVKLENAIKGPDAFPTKLRIFLQFYTKYAMPGLHQRTKLCQGFH